jgi:hypothetical protein
MKVRVRAVRLRAQTASGAFGRTVWFQPGFNVVRGGNSRGKTQVVQAMIYALGLERMLQARANTPLGSALTSELRVSEGEGAPGLPVVSSWVAIELESGDGRLVTVQRQVRHPRIQADLVRVWNGPALTDPTSVGISQDLFLHRPGSASRDLGFHKLLADLFGWSLPQVGTRAGTMTTLYPDVVFPFLIVDQQSWGSAAPRKVDRYQIREPIRRAAEFLLSLTGPIAEAQRAELEQSMAELRTRWASARSAVDTLAGTVGGRVAGVPEHAAGAQARATAPEPTRMEDAALQVLEDGQWVSAADVLTRLAEQLRQAQEAGQRRIAADVDEVTLRQLDDARSQLADLVAAARLVEQDLSMGEAQLAALDRRLSMLEEERARNTDIRTLVRLGSQVAASHMADHNCPTCRQSLDAVETSDLGPILDVDETVALLNAQISTTRKMRDRAQSTVSQASNAYAAMQRQADQMRANVKALEADVLAPADTPSTGDVARQVTLQLRHDELLRIQASIADRMGELADMSEQIAATRAQLSELPAGVPERDAQRLSELTTLMRQRLAATRFDSYDVNDVTLDLDSLRPSRVGFDIDTDVSASDVVRIKVAYLDAVRVLGQAQGQHPGLLVLDEPRQQDIDPADYTAMLQYLARSTNIDGQVIVTSATPRAELDPMISTIPTHVTDIGEQRLLQPEPAEDPLDPQ